MILPVYKPPGWTPLEALDALRARVEALAQEPMVYAGRLDPMAEGVLLVLTGADRDDLAAHLGHDKAYVATLLFGLASDTHDALGRLAPPSPPPSLEAATAAVAGLGGEHLLPLPAWSAYRVSGRPLHAWAAEGRLGEVEVPVRTMRVTAVTVDHAAPTTPGALLPELRGRIGRVRGAFRQAEALADWEALPDDTPLVAVGARLTVTSGTYVRSLAHAVGAALGGGALLLALRRTRVGPWDQAAAMRLVRSRFPLRDHS